MNSLSWRFKKIFTDRVFILFFFVCLIFIVLGARLFFMQIINGQLYLDNLSLNIVKKINIVAPRGNIYDRYGQPIAQNKSVYNVKLDQSIHIDNLNESLYNLIKLFEKNNEDYLDDLPITKNKPFEFTFDTDSEKTRWFRDMNLNKNLSANEVIEHLRKFFDIPKELDDVEARKIISLRTKLYKQRYRQYNPLTLALNVSDKTIVSIEEENNKYPTIYVEGEPIRDYVNPKCFSNIIGYIGNITDKELEANEDYDASDTIGKAGLEKSFEKNLRGKDGELLVQVNNMGKRVGTINKNNPVSGNDLFLTIDRNLQEKSYEILENTLTKILVAKLKNGTINFNNLFATMINTNTLSIKKIFESSDDSYSGLIKKFVLKNDSTVDYTTGAGQQKIRKIICDAVKNQNISIKNLLLVMREQDIISGDSSYFKNSSATQIFYDKLNTNEINPGMFNFDPCSGSVVVLDVDNGDVLTAVSYPSYDNNKLVSSFSNDYYSQILSAVNTPMVNRPFMEPRAPGSTFKMITAVTGLEKGVITPTSTIYDETTFKKAGLPYSRCWSSHSHGALNVSSALEVSCNYFFFETAYRLGNSKSKNLLDGIHALNYYMREFGLDERSGVEIGELYDFSEEGISNISSPEYKLKNGQKSKWYDGDTIRTAIGQAKNNYTAANMAKYINTLASGGKRFQLHLTKEIKDENGNSIEKTYPKLEKTVEIQKKNLDAVYKGMLLVTEGNRGTGRSAFNKFPIRVAGKTGTAQENNNRPDHTSFGGFAPFENPRIAIYVVVPFGDTKLMIAPASQIARDVIKEYFQLDRQQTSATAETNCLTK